MARDAARVSTSRPDGGRATATPETAAPDAASLAPGRPLPGAFAVSLAPVLQRSAGNAAVGAMVRGVATASGPQVQRRTDEGEGMRGPGREDAAAGPGGGPEAEAEPGEAAEARAAEARASATLTNERFTSIPRLAELVRGGPQLGRRDDGRPVEAVQVALLDIGYSLLRYEHDGHWGGETDAAIALFRSDHGLGDSGGMDADAMEALDGAAPAAGTATEHTVDYDRLFADDRLDVTLAIGYDENGGHTTKIERAHGFLTERGFSRTDEEGSTDPVEHWSVTRDLTFPTGSGERSTRAITVNVSVVTPGTGSAARFGDALADSELTLYTGHARRGIGPDFDPDRSPAENFVFGVGSALHAAGRAVEPRQVEQHHYVIDRVNDLEEMTRAGRFDQERYRVWFFNACSTLAYVDELRGGLLPEAVDRRNLDLFGTRRSVPTAAGLDTTFAVLDGVMNAQTMEQIVRTMGRISAEVAAANGFSPREAAEMRDAYWREGAADNPVAPAAVP